MKIKIFISDISICDLENKIAEWTNELNPKIILATVNINVISDYYPDSAPPKIYDTWLNYTCTIVY